MLGSIRVSHPTTFSTRESQRHLRNRFFHGLNDRLRNSLRHKYETDCSYEELLQYARMVESEKSESGGGMNLSQLRQLKPKLPLLSNNNNNLNQKEMMIWLDLRRPTEVVRENLLKCKSIYNKCKKLSLPGMLLLSSLQLIPLLSRTVESEVIVAIANHKIQIHLLKIQANIPIKIKIITQMVEGIEVEEEEEAIGQEEDKQLPHQVNLKVGTDFVSGVGILLLFDDANHPIKECPYFKEVRKEGWQHQQQTSPPQPANPTSQNPTSEGTQ